MEQPETTGLSRMECPAAGSVQCLRYPKPAIGETGFPTAIAARGSQFEEKQLSHSTKLGIITKMTKIKTEGKILQTELNTYQTPKTYKSHTSNFIPIPFE